jgi:Ni/Fe-hydrogenase subunit HybB-like protein
MLEKALSGDRKYWGWVIVLLVVIATGGYFYLQQLQYGLGITGLSRDVSWGFYIAQFTFLVGVAASAVMVVLPYYLHNFKAFGRVTILGEFLAIAAVIMCLMFIVVDLGQPARAVNIVLHPSPASILFWDMIVLNGYLFLNFIISRVSLIAERKGEAPPSWIKPVILLSIPWAISIHTVTAFIYSGLAARPFWLTAILAPRFLASAFSSGPSLLILLCLILRRITRFDAGKEAIQKLALIVTYAMLINIFFVLMEVFTALYSSIPEDAEHFQYLYVGLKGHAELARWMWASSTLSVLAVLLLLSPRLRERPAILGLACTIVIVAIWIEKGLAMVVAGFVPSPLGKVTAYTPTAPELLISLAIYGVGALILTLLYKIALSVRGELSV